MLIRELDHPLSAEPLKFRALQRCVNEVQYSNSESKHHALPTSCMKDCQ